MNEKNIIGLIAIVAIASIVAFSGCIEKTPESQTPETPSDVPSKTKGTVIDVMKQVPNEPPIIYINLENMREDADLLYWEYYQNSVVRMLRDAGIPEVAISVDKLAGFDDAFLVWGDFELKKIIYYLEDESWQQDTYREVEVWYRESGKVNEDNKSSIS